MSAALIAFLRARADADAQWAEGVLDCGSPNDHGIARRTLREVEAKRRIIDQHQDVNDGSCGTCVEGRWGYPTHGGSDPQRFSCATLRILALPYDDHPDFEESWRP